MRAILLLLSLFFGFLETLVVFSQPIWIRFVNPFSAANLGYYSGLFTLIAFLVEPVLVFGVMFYVGGRFDLRSEYASSFSALLIGSLVGTIGSTIVLDALVLAGNPEFDLLGFSAGAVLYGGIGSLRLALVAFAGLAFAFFSKGVWTK